MADRPEEPPVLFTPEFWKERERQRAEDEAAEAEQRAIEDVRAAIRDAQEAMARLACALARAEVALNAFQIEAEDEEDDPDHPPF